MSSMHTSTPSKRPDFFPPMETVLGGAGIGVPAYLASRFEYFSRGLNAIYICCHLTAFGMIVWFLCADTWGSHSASPKANPKFHRKLALFAAAIIAVLVYVSWYGIVEWSDRPEKQFVIFIGIFFSGGGAYLEVFGWHVFRRQRRLNSVIEGKDYQAALELLGPRLAAKDVIESDLILAMTLHWELGHEEEARQLMEQVLNKSGRDRIALNNVASACYSRNRHVEGLALINEALAGDGPIPVEISLNQCLILVALGHLNDARTPWQCVKNIHEQGGLAHLDAQTLQANFATIRAALKDFED